MGPKEEHSGHRRWKFPSRFKRSEKDDKHNKTQPESDRPENPQSIEPSDDPWTDAFKQLSPELQAKLRTRGMDENRTASMRDQVEEFKREAERLQESSRGKDWKFALKGQEILVRDLTTRIVGWAIKIGDVAIPFASATSVAAAVWGCATLFLKGIQNFDTEKKALLSIAELVAQAMFLGQLYFKIYTYERTGNLDVITNLRKATVDVYICVLTLLAKSLDLTSNTVTQFCRSMFEENKPSGMLSNLASQKSALNEAASLCEATAKALEVKDFKNLLRATEIFKRQYFQRINENEQRRIRNWVSMVPYALHRQDIEEKRSKDTGNWLIQHEGFFDWMQSSSSKVLRLQGSPGTGKTFLTANVVTYLEDHIASTGGGFAYFFCNRDEDDRRRSSLILRSLVRQLATTGSIDNSIRRSLQELWEKSQKDNLNLGLSDCRKQLRESFDTYPTTFVVLDALDEVDKEDLHILLENIRHTMSKTENIVKLFVASRPEVGVSHERWPTVTIQAQDNYADIKKYVEGEVKQFIDDYHRDRPDQGPEFIPAVEEMKDKIIHDILDKCDNMFLWAALQIKRILLDCHTVEAIETVLKALPMGLNQEYDRILEDIKRFPSPEPELVEHTLKWVYSAPGLLQTEEILSAIRIRVKNGSLILINAVNRETLLSMCRSLLVVDSNDQWRFCHLSAREYLDKKVESNENFSDASSLCAEICFRTLLLSFNPQNTVFARAENKNPDRFKTPFHPANPFSRYCQVYWIFYAKTKVIKASHVSLLERFLGSPNEARSFYLKWFDYALDSRSRKDGYIRRGLVSDYQKTLRPDGWPYREGREGQLPKAPIFLVAYFALYGPLRKWRENSDISPLQLTGSEDYLLTVAAKSSCKPLCTTLLAKGRSADKESLERCLSQALVAATDQGDMDMVKYLIKKGANASLSPEPKGEFKSCSGPVDAATQRGNIDLVRYLMEEANAVVGDALFWAAELKSEEAGLVLIKYLIESHKADPNSPPERHHFSSALVAAASEGKLEIVKYLVEEAGAKPDLQLKVGSHGSALTAALASAEDRGLETVKYLVLHTQVNLPLLCGDYGSALAAAIFLSSAYYARRVNMDIVRFLIEAGADVNMQHQVGDYGSPFVTAAFFVTDIDMIHYLVDKCEANIHAQHSTGNYGSALAAAANGGNLAVVKYLVDSRVDADCELQVGAYGSALAAAAAADRQYWDPAVVKYLVDLGVDTNRELQVGAYGSALIAAIATKRLEQVRYLVERGNANVDLCLKSGSFGSALLAAIISPFDFAFDQDLVELFWESRLDMDLATQVLGDKITRVALSATFAHPHWRKYDFPAVKYLVDAGANVNLELQVGAYGNALSAAVAIGNIEQVKYLVTEGSADANFQLKAGSFGSALEVAIIVYSKIRELHSDAIYSIQKIVSGQLVRMNHRDHPLEGMTTRIAQSMVDALMRSLLAIMKYLLKSGADANLQLHVGPYGSALAAAAATGSFWHVKYLVENAQADVHLQLKNGSYANAYEAAVAHEHHEIAEYLAQIGNDSEAMNPGTCLE
ncbi:hypothetical protein N7528_004138 [Penicillium herquei]|nr:hypothetical protein N7528_004138 [Penicillium herquei]